MDFKIADREIGPSYRPYVIAEISANHNGDICKAKKIILEAKRAGADAVKIQTYRADTITIKSDLPDFMIEDGLWAGQSLYELYEQAHTPWEWHRELFSFAREMGITIFSSPFDTTAVDFLEELNAPAYKIASFEAIDLPLIRYVAATGKPMIISTGMADETEIGEAITAAREAGCKQLAVLHCVSGYPAPAEDYNLRTISDMIDRFGVIVGLSDHTISNTTAVLSVAFGASIVEKHVTLDRDGGGPDDSFSLEPKDLTDLCDQLSSAWLSLGCVDYGRKSSERANIKFRRSIYAVKDIEVGEAFTSDNVKSIRPGYGLKPKFLPEVLNRRAAKKIHAGTPLAWELVRDN
nr:pseudaminic acid synthase [uncultured Cohaesibacter sp.]